MADNYEIRYLEDEKLIRQILGLQETDPLPNGVAKEYSIRLAMMHRAGNTGRSLDTRDIINILRGLDLKPKREDRLKEPESPVDWRTVPEGTRVIVQSPDFPGQVLKGLFRGCRGSAALSVELPSKDPRFQSLFPKHVKIDNGQLEDLPHVANIPDEEWDEVLLGTLIVAMGDDGKEVTGMLAELGPGPDRLTLLLHGGSGKTVCVDRRNASVSDEAMASV